MASRKPKKAGMTAMRLIQNILQKLRQKKKGTR